MFLVCPYVYNPIVKNNKIERVLLVLYLLGMVMCDFYYYK